MGLKLKRREAEKEFAKMDANGGGVVLFDEFCVWYTGKINPEREIATCTSQFVEKKKKKKEENSDSVKMRKLEVHTHSML